MIPNQNQYPGPAWNALPYNIYSDGPNGSSTLPAGDSPNGQLNLGQMHQMPNLMGGGGDPRSSLVNFLSQIAAQMHQGQGQGAQFRPAYPGSDMGTGSAPGQPGPPNFHMGAFPGLGQHPVVDRFHAVSAANQLAQMLASQHTATLNRYRGRN